MSAIAVSSDAPASQIAAVFAEKDNQLKVTTKNMAPVRKAKKVLADKIREMLSKEEREEDRVIRLPGGEVVRLKVKEVPEPLKPEYIASRLLELMETEAEANQLTQAIMDGRPMKTKYSVVREKETATNNGAQPSRKRGRKAAAEEGGPQSAAKGSRLCPTPPPPSPRPT